MSQLVETAILKLRQLPEPEQDALASIILQEIDDEARWDELFAKPESAELLAKMATEAMRDIEAGLARTLDLDDL
jgi:hypothetical protein